MYQEHFGLYMSPFALSPQTRFVYQSRAFEETMAHLVYGLEGGEDIILITGAVGTGKTLALHHLVKHVSDVYVPVLINVTQVDFTGLLKMVLAELGVESSVGADRADLLLRLKVELEKIRGQGKRLLVLIDEAQNLDADTLEGVRLLTNLGPVDEQVLQVVLSGQPGLRRRLAESGLIQLQQRIRVHYHLEPLDAEETAAYLEHRCRVAGAERPLFEREAARLIHRLTGGIPRLINILADKALLAAYVDGAERVRAGHVPADEPLPRTPEALDSEAARAAEGSEVVTVTPPAPPPTLEESGTPLEQERAAAQASDRVEPSGEGIAGDIVAGDAVSEDGASGMAAASKRDDGEEPEIATGNATETVEPPAPLAVQRRHRRSRVMPLMGVLLLIAAVFLLPRLREQPLEEPGAVVDSVSRDVPAAAVTSGGSIAESLATAASETVPASVTVGSVDTVPAMVSQPADGDTAAAAVPEPSSVAVPADTLALPFPAVTPGLYVLVGSFRDTGRARHMGERVAAADLPVRWMRKEIRGQVWYRILVGPWEGSAQAGAAERKLRAAGIHDDLLQIRIRP